MIDTQTLCRACGQLLPAPFLDLGTTPLANSYVAPDELAVPDPRYPLAVAYCLGCHLVQLTHTVPPAELFSEYLYFSSYSDSFLRHAERMALDLTGRLGLGKDSLVVEVASNDGYLLQYFQRAGVRVVGVEPARNIAAVAVGKGIPTLNRFFGPDLVAKILADHGAADLVIGCNVLAHAPDISAFLDAARRTLEPTGMAVFEFPYLAALLDRVEFDTIYHEHVFYLSLSAIEGVARRAGLEVQDVTHQPVHGHSLRVALQLPGTRPVAPAVGQLLEEERLAGLTGPERYADFSRQVQTLERDLVAMLRSLKAEGKRLAAYGAPAKGNTLLNTCGIDTSLLEFTVDRSPHKQGMFTPGARLPIRPPAALLEQMPDYTLVLPWNIVDEIVEQQAEYLQRGGRFIVPVPTPRVLSSSGVLISRGLLPT